MKKTLLIFLGLIMAFFYLSGDVVNAAVTIPGTDEIERVSIDTVSGGNAVYNINILGFEILTIIKRFMMGLLVIYAVYAGAMMIMSMGSDEERLSSAKRQLWYFLVAFVFINIPISLFRAFNVDSDTSVGASVSTDAFEQASTDTTGNLFFDFTVFAHTLNNQIIFFLEVMIFIAAVFMITMAGINVMTSRGREDKMKEAKNKIVYTILGLVFVGVIEAWKTLAFDGEISDGVNLFESLSNLALFFAAPVAIFFLSLAAYYYITSNGDEERVKKSKSIIVNTVLATLILLAAYTFLLDLASL